MNYGYTMEEGRLTLYLHSAVQGRKLDMMRANPKVFFDIDCDLMPFEGRVPCQYGLVYSSIMGRGTATMVEDVEEKKQAMTLLMKTQTGKDFTFEDRLVSIVAVVRIDVAEYTAKHRPLPEGYEVIYGRK
jgi:nitroimidazol reductase NimA-like FMN-containing flavoprotein (pyridoxamine 5'-phosphate oxidase superfamily)